MATTYKQFLASPSSALLAENASLHYVTTLTSFVGAAQIIKHLSTLQKQVKKKKEDVLNVIDGQNIIAVEADTHIEFITSGGVYLPGLDDNFLSDREAFLPIMHIVTFDDEGKIAQIRQQWDQASLLKQLEIIGKSGRNWPIKDGKEQLSLIQSCIKSTFTPAQAQNGNGTPKPRNNASTNAMRDPHASLHLFGSREDVENTESANVVSPYSGQKPKQRAFTDILTDEPQHWDDDAKRRSLPPAKIGAGRNAQPIRIFEGQQHNEGDSDDEQKGPRYIRAHPAKYQHFAMNDGSAAEESEDSNTASSANQAPRAKSKHDSTWSFEDFVTPVKSKPGRAQGSNPDARRFDTGEERAAEPIKPMVAKARRDAEAHFEIQDDGELPPEERRIATKTRGAIRNEGLYNNNLFDREAQEAPARRALGNITNVKDRGKHFDPHFAMSDEAPAQAAPRQPVTESLQKVIKTMNTSWSLTDESPAPAPQKENQAGPGKGPDSKIHIAGDGMGGKKGTQRDFIFGGDDAAEPPKQIIGRKGNHGTQKSAFWDL
ncbi:hypothetical protein GGI43DRAFT_318395 [Trichoderma evansii]